MTEPPESQPQAMEEITEEDFRARFRIRVPEPRERQLGLLLGGVGALALAGLVTALVLTGGDSSATPRSSIIEAAPVAPAGIAELGPPAPVPRSVPDAAGSDFAEITVPVPGQGLPPLPISPASPVPESGEPSGSSTVIAAPPVIPETDDAATAAPESEEVRRTETEEAGTPARTASEPPPVTSVTETTEVTVPETGIPTSELPETDTPITTTAEETEQPTPETETRTVTVSPTATPETTPTTTTTTGESATTAATEGSTGAATPDGGVGGRNRECDAGPFGLCVTPPSLPALTAGRDGVAVERQTPDRSSERSARERSTGRGAEDGRGGPRERDDRNGRDGLIDRAGELTDGLLGR